MNIPYNTTDGMLCAGYTNAAKDTCYGDSGGPLACLAPYIASTDNDGSNATQFATIVSRRWTLYGITSGGAGCANYRQYPGGVYTNVFKYKSWIERTMFAVDNDKNVEERLGTTASSKDDETTVYGIRFM